jgi:hypothetical protein
MFRKQGIPQSSHIRLYIYNSNEKSETCNMHNWYAYYTRNDHTISVSNITQKYRRYGLPYFPSVGGSYFRSRVVVLAATLYFPSKGPCFDKWTVDSAAFYCYHYLALSYDFHGNLWRKALTPNIHKQCCVHNIMQEH